MNASSSSSLKQSEKEKKKARRGACNCTENRPTQNPRPLSAVEAIEETVETGGV